MYIIYCCVEYYIISYIMCIIYTMHATGSKNENSIYLKNITATYKTKTSLKFHIIYIYIYIYIYIIYIYIYIRRFALCAECYPCRI